MRYLDYYVGIKERLGIEHCFLIDNGSEAKLASFVQGTFPQDLTLLRYPHLAATGKVSDLDYPYCWRALYALKILMLMGYEKILCIDSDVFVLSPGLADYIKRLNSGWTAFHIPKYDFPSAEAHILCKDAFPVYEAFCAEKTAEARNGSLMERELPFTHIERGFNADRWGEEGVKPTSEMDLYSQNYGNLDFVFVPF